MPLRLSYFLHKWKEDFPYNLVIQLMFAIKADEMVSEVVLLEYRLSILYRVVVHTHETPTGLLLFLGDTLELLTLHHVVVLYDVLSNLECLGTIISAIEELMFTCLQALGHCGHIERRIDKDTLEVTHLLGIHTTHTRTDDKVRILRPDILLQVRQSLHWVNRYIWCNNLIIWQQITQNLYRATGMR